MFFESYWTFKLLNNFKAKIMLCFEIWISLFVLKLFNILHSFLVTVVYRLQVRGKTLGLCSAQAIEVFTSTGVSGLGDLRYSRDVSPSPNLLWLSPAVIYVLAEFPC